MITGTAALLPYLWIIFGSTLLLTVGMLALCMPLLLRFLQRFSPAARREWLWYLAAAPWLSAVILVLVTLLPSFTHEQGWSIDHCHFHGDSHAHICWFHPADFHLLSLWGGLAITLLAAAGIAAFQTSTHYWRYYQTAQSLLEFSETTPAQYRQLDSDLPSAFTLGLWRPQRIISRALSRQLPKDALDIVLMHEQAHILRRDPLQLWLFHGLTHLWPRNARTQLRMAFVLAVEQQADAYVARFIADRALIASTLITVHRLTAHHMTPIQTLPVCAFGANALELRVRHLLEDPPTANVPRRRLLMAAFVVIGLCVWHANSLHHAVEFLFSHYLFSH